MSDNDVLHGEKVRLSPTVTEALADQGVTVDHTNRPQKGKRTNKDIFARVISATREAESQANKELRVLEAENRELHRMIDDLRTRVSMLEAVVRGMRVKETLDSIAALTADDKVKLLELAS